MNPEIEYETANARCNLCDGEMPCDCPIPDDIDEQIQRQLDDWAKYSDMLDDR